MRHSAGWVGGSVRWRRIAVSAAVLVLIGTALVQGWVNSHTVDLIVVNASGRPVEVSWQPTPFAALVSLTDPGCNSRSMPVSRGTSWVVARDGQTLLDSSSANLPLLSSLVAVEIWLDPNGSVRIVGPHEVAALVDAPSPDCQNAAS